MIYVFDLDGVLCPNAMDGQSVYDVSPFKERITKVNRLYEQGHRILIDTARGSRTGIDHFEKTTEQLKRWGVKYHVLRTGIKLYGDLYIDDRGTSDKDFFR